MNYPDNSDWWNAITDRMNSVKPPRIDSVLVYRFFLICVLIAFLVGIGYFYHLKIKEAENVVYDSCVVIYDACEGGTLDVRLEQDIKNGEGAIKCYCTQNGNTADD